jgi:flavin-dependent dehydrogenase
MLDVDVLIIGAGPAGISTALHLLHQDPSWAKRMLILEKAAHPRPKLCGGGLTRYGLEILRDLGLPMPLPLAQARVDDIRFAYGQRLVHVRAEPMFAVFHRAELDAYLAQHAVQQGAQISENEAVQHLEFEEQSILVTTARDAYRARVVVGADGSKGAVRQSVRERRQPARVARLLETLQPAHADAAQYVDRYALFDFNLVQNNLQGYTWDFPSYVAGAPLFNRGIYDARLAASRPRADLPGLLGSWLLPMTAGREHTALAGHPLHWFSPRARFSQPRLLLVGDAAGAEPLFGEGIAPALGYGKVAAAAIQSAFRSQDFSFTDYRRRILSSDLGRYLLLRWTVAQVVYRWSDRPWFMHLVWSLGDILARIWPPVPKLY